MFEALRIRIFGTQPVAKVSDNTLERLIQREFDSLSNEVKQRFKQLNSDTHNGKNRLSAAILKLSNKDLSAIDFYIGMSNNDFRDVIYRAEYPRSFKFGFGEMKENKKRIYLDDWTEYNKWINE